jgi:antibiotic biosynthesis monooxygenase (ABM) superfamily enzyme
MENGNRNLACYLSFNHFSFGKQISQIEILPLRTLIMTLVLVPTMVFILMPTIMKLLGGWLKN